MFKYNLLTVNDKWAWSPSDACVIIMWCVAGDKDACDSCSAVCALLATTSNVQRAAGHISSNKSVS